MMRPIRLCAAALLALSVLGVPRDAGAARTADAAQASNSYFSALVTKGPDTGMIVEGLLALDGSGGGSLTLGDGTSATVTASTATSPMTLTAALASSMTISGSGTPAGKQAVSGTFTGPKSNDSGVWTAVNAPTVLDYAITGNISSGPHAGQQVLIGDLYAFVTTSGMLFGKYVDNSKAGPGIVAKIVPVHGTYINNIITASIAFSPRTSYALVGHTRLFFGQNGLTGNLIGPNSRDSGSWSGLANNSAA